MKNLYKALSIIALVLVVGTFAVGTALAATITTGSNSFITVLTERISPMNRNLNVNGSQVTVGWMTNQFTDGYVEVEGEDLALAFEANYGTYHVSTFSLPKGEYTATRVSYNGGLKDMVQTFFIN